MASFHHSIKSGKKGTAREHAAYIERKGKYRDREDVVHSGHGNLPAWANGDPEKFWKAADANERVNGAAYREHEIALPCELSIEQNRALAERLVQELVGAKPYAFAVHATEASLGGVTNIHLHAMYSDRVPDGIERSPEQTFARYNRKNPEKGGCRKDSGGRPRSVLKEEVMAQRKRVADIQNQALADHGVAARVDHRSLREQGEHRPAERHLGPARIQAMSVEARSEFVAGRPSVGREGTEAPIQP